jgi:hypothetical protein
VRFEVLTAITTKNIFWDVVPWSIAEFSRQVGGKYYFYLQDRNQAIKKVQCLVATIFRVLLFDPENRNSMFSEKLVIYCQATRYNIPEGSTLRNKILINNLQDEFWTSNLVEIRRIVLQIKYMDW